MKTLSKNRINNTRYLAIAIMLGFMVLLLSGTASAQAPTKGKKVAKIPQATLKETKITASVITAVDEISPMKIRLNVLNPTGKSVRISIRNYEGIAVFADDFRGREYTKILNFNSILPGQYTLRVNAPKQFETRRFLVDSKRNRILYQADLQGKNNPEIMTAIHISYPTKIMLHLVNNTGKPVSYVLRNEKKEAIYQGVIKTTHFSKIFDLMEATDGKYTVDVNYQAEKVASRTFDMRTSFNRSFTWTDKRGRPLTKAGQTVASMEAID